MYRIDKNSKNLIFILYKTIQFSKCLSHATHVMTVFIIAVYCKNVNNFFQSFFEICQKSGVFCPFLPLSRSTYPCVCGFLAKIYPKILPFYPYIYNIICRKWLTFDLEK